MGFEKAKEYQTIRLFAILGFLTLMIVLLFKVVLFAPQNYEAERQPANNANAAFLQPKSEADKLNLGKDARKQ